MILDSKEHGTSEIKLNFSTRKGQENNPSKYKLSLLITRIKKLLGKMKMPEDARDKRSQLKTGQMKP